MSTAACTLTDEKDLYVSDITLLCKLIDQPLICKTLHRQVWIETKCSAALEFVILPVTCELFFECRLSPWINALH